MKDDKLQNMSIFYYHTEDYLKGKLLEDGNLADTNIRIEHLLDDEAQELVEILEENMSDDGHRCISVYRDAFEFNKNVYNICLSCGDFYKNDERFYLSDEGLKKAKEFKRMILAK